MLLVGLGNKARNGKDTAAEAIQHYYAEKSSQWNDVFADGRFLRVGIFKFATALYQEVNQLFAENPNFWRSSRIVDGIMLPEWVQPDPNPEISELAPYGKHPKLLQWWGTNYRRAQDPDYWVKALFKSMPANMDIELISDVRFPGEADAIKQFGGHIVNVQRLNQDGTQYYSSDRAPDHQSEVALDNYNWDYFIKAKSGQVALVGEQAITLAEYLRGLEKK